MNNSPDGLTPAGNNTDIKRVETAPNGLAPVNKIPPSHTGALARILIKISGTAILPVSIAVLGLIRLKELPLPYEDHPLSVRSATENFVAALICSAVVKLMDIALEAHPDYKLETMGFHKLTKFNLMTASVAGMSAFVFIEGTIKTFFIIGSKDGDPVFEKGFFWHVLVLLLCITGMLATAFYSLDRKPARLIRKFGTKRAAITMTILLIIGTIASQIILYRIGKPK